MSAEKPKVQMKLRRSLCLRWLALWPLTMGLAIYPVSNRVLRLATLLMLALLWGGALWLFWRLKWLRMIAIGLPVLLIAFAILPGQEINRPALQNSYALSLRSFEGSRYVWGGENHLGIDCSGLVRAALINAGLRESAQTMNPSLLRFALDLWWHDCSARALGEEYRHKTFRLFYGSAINTIDSTRMQVGDLATTADGIHVLAYLGGNQWIEADPDARKVIVVATPSTNAWFETPVNIVRWRALNEPSDQTQTGDR